VSSSEPVTSSTQPSATATPPRRRPFPTGVGTRNGLSAFASHTRKGLSESPGGALVERRLRRKCVHNYPPGDSPGRRRRATSHAGDPGAPALSAAPTRRAKVIPGPICGRRAAAQARVRRVARGFGRVDKDREVVEGAQLWAKRIDALHDGAAAARRHLSERIGFTPSGYRGHPESPRARLGAG
jgi:hypothetical protein